MPRLLDCATQLGHCSRNILQRDQSDTLETGTELEIFRVQPIVVGFCVSDSPRRKRHLAERQSFGGIEHAEFESHLFEKLQPFLRADVRVEGAGLALFQSRCVEAIEARQHPPWIHMAGGFKGFADVADHLVDLFHHMAIAIDIFVRHCSSVAKDGRPPVAPTVLLNSFIAVTKSVTSYKTAGRCRLGSPSCAPALDPCAR